MHKCASNESEVFTRMTFLFLSAGLPLVMPAYVTSHAIIKIGRIVTLMHFWEETSHESYSLKERLKAVGNDVKKIASIPLVVAGCECAALLGIFYPDKGKKMMIRFTDEFSTQFEN